MISRFLRYFICAILALAVLLPYSATASDPLEIGGFLSGQSTSPTTGTLWTWGDNSIGQLGDGTTTEKLSPVQIGSSLWIDVSASPRDQTNMFTMGIRSDGTLWGWGSNGVSRAGIPTGGIYYSPASVGDGSSWTNVEIGFNGGHALRSDGTLWGWGWNSNGRVGIGTTTNPITSPTQITTPSSTGWEGVANNGVNHTLALRNGGELWAWGINQNGRTGLGTTTGQQNSPARVGAESGWDRIAAGGGYSLAIRNGQLFSWGSDSLGQLGNGPALTANVTQPARVGNDSDWAEISAGRVHALAIKEDGTLWGWGDNSDGQISSLESAQVSSPVQIGSQSGWRLVDAAGSDGTSTADEYSVGIREGNRLYTWGGNSFGTLAKGDKTASSEPQLQGRASFVSAGGRHAAGIDFSSTAPPLPTEVPQISGAARVGTSLQVSEGLWEALPSPSLSYQWQREEGGSWSNIPGATSSTYTPVGADSGKRLRAVVTASNSAGSAASESAATAQTLQAPSLLAPTISGEARVGQTLAGNVSASGFPDPSLSYQWQASDTGSGGWSNISGATSTTYLVSAAESGKYLRVQVTGTNSEGWSLASSSSVGPVRQLPLSVSLPSITGSPSLGATLEASPGSWQGFPALSFSYQWQLCLSAESCTDIDGATSQSLVIGEDLLDQRVRVLVRAENADGFATALSPLTDQIAINLPENTSLPAISGDSVIGGALEASFGTWSGNPRYEYQWQSCAASCEDIVGATSDSYSPRAEDVAKTLRVRVRATNSVGTAEAFSLLTEKIAEPPSLSLAPAISGDALVGALLVSSGGSWQGYPAPTLSYQWQRCTGEGCSDIEGATGSSYAPVLADAGKEIRVRVLASNRAGTATATSPRVGPVTRGPVVISLPTITGTALLGEILQGDSGTWEGYPEPALDFFWQRCSGGSCEDIAGAEDKTYTLSRDDVAQTIRLRVLATNSRGSTSAESASTDPVGGSPRVLSAPTLTGTLQVGSTLVAQPGSWEGYPAPALSYQWQACEGSQCFDIDGATTSSLLLSSNESGRRVRIRIQASNIYGSVTATSTTSDEISDGEPLLNTSPPTISGTLLPGQTLLSSPGTWSLDGLQFSYQWQRSSGGAWKNIPFATSATLELSGEYPGQQFRVRVQARVGTRTAAAWSSATGTLEKEPEALSRPELSGSAAVGQTLSASSGSWSAWPLPSYSYQWQRQSSGNWSDISGATATSYFVSSADQGKALRVRVRASNTAGGSSSTTDAFSLPLGISSQQVRKDNPFSYSLVFQDRHALRGLAPGDIRNAASPATLPSGAQASALSGCSYGLPQGYSEATEILPGTVVPVSISCPGTIGVFRPELREGAVADAAANPGPSAASLGESVVIDRENPAAEWSAPSSPTRDRPFVFYLSWKDHYEVSGLEATDLSNTATAADNPAGVLQPLSSCSYSIPSQYRGAYKINPGQRVPITVTCASGTGVFQPGLDSGAVVDTAGNLSLASSGPSLTVDQTAPSVSWERLSDSPRLGTTFTYRLRFLDHSSVLDLDASDIDFRGNLPGLSRCQITNDIPSSGSSGTFVDIEFSCPRAASGLYDFWPSLRAGTIEDGAGNIGPTSDIAGEKTVFDYDPPQGGALVVNGVAATFLGSESYSSVDTFSFVKTDASDQSEPVVNEVLLERADLRGDVCLGNWNSASIEEENPQVVPQSGCWRYILSSRDSLGNEARVSTTVKTDLLEPTVALEIDNVSGSTWVDGLRVFYAAVPGRNGSFRVRSGALDEETGIASVIFPSPPEFLSGGGSDTLSPFQSTYSWSGQSLNSVGPQVVRAINRAGGSKEGSFELIRDTAAPTVSWQPCEGTKSNSGWFLDSPVCTAVVTDPLSGPAEVSAERSGDGNAWQEEDISWTSPAGEQREARTTVSGEGDGIRLRARSSDRVGLESSWSESEVLRIDRTPPVNKTKISSPYHGSFRLLPSQSGPGALNVSDSVSGWDQERTECWVRPLGSSGEGTSIPCDSDITSSQQVRYRVWDRAGWSTSSEWQDVRIEDSVIALSIEGGNDGWSPGADFSVVAEVVPGEGATEPSGGWGLDIDEIRTTGVSYNIDGDSASIPQVQMVDMDSAEENSKQCFRDTCSMQVSLDLPGKRELFFQAFGARDALGQGPESEIVSQEVRIDRTPPQIAATPEAYAVRGGEWRPTSVWLNDPEIDTLKRIVRIDFPIEDPPLVLEIGGQRYSQPSSGLTSSRPLSCSYGNRSCRNQRLLSTTWNTINYQADSSLLSGPLLGGKERCTSTVNIEGQNELSCVFDAGEVFPNPGAWLVAHESADAAGNSSFLPAPDPESKKLPPRTDPNYVRGLTRSQSNQFCPL